MAAPYSYPPPPPPPPQTSQGPQPGPPAGYPQYQPSPYGQPLRGGGHLQGRSGFNQGPQQPHQGYNGAPAPMPSYPQPGQPGGPYIGPQQPAANGYPTPQQWRGNDPQQAHQQPPHAQLPPQGYHPNYAPQAYGQPMPPQQPPYGAPQPYYPQPGQYQQPMQQMRGPQQPQGPGPQQWQGSPQHQQPPQQFNGAGRGRGGGGGRGGRGGLDAPLMGPPIRMGFDSDRSNDPMPQASSGFPPYAGSPQTSQQTPPLPFSPPAFQPQPQYQSYPPANTFSSPRGGRLPFDQNQNQQFNHGSRGGRGGGFRGRGRGNFNDRGGRGKQFNGHHKHGDSSTSDLPQKPAADVGSKSGEKKKKKKKRKTNTLGLTPGTEEYQESEEEDDVDEEAKLAVTIMNSDANGPVPEMPADLAAWIEERKKKYPTKERREAKQAELAQRRVAAAEQASKDKKAKQDQGGDRKLEKQRLKAEKLRKQLERAEQKVQEAMKAGMKRKRDSGDVGDEDDIKIEGDAVDQVIATATAGASLSDSDSDSEGSSEYTDATDSEDEAPQHFTSKRNAPVQVPPPAKKNILQRHCKYFSTGGTCGKKGKCRFIHDEAVRAAAIREKDLNGGRMTLAQRLTQNDKEKDDLMVLKSIKYLFEKGMLDEPQPQTAQVSKVSAQVSAMEVEDRDVDYNE